MAGDLLAIIRAYLVGQATLTAIVGQRIYAPRLPEGVTLPAIGYFIRGGSSNPYVPPHVEPSVQFDCWADSAIGARAVYGALYEVLQGVQNQDVVIAPNTYRLLSAIEETQGQDIQTVDYPNYYRVMTFYRIMIQTTEV